MPCFMHLIDSYFPKWGFLEVLILCWFGASLLYILVTVQGNSFSILLVSVDRHIFYPRSKELITVRGRPRTTSALPSLKVRTRYFKDQEFGKFCSVSGYCDAAFKDYNYVINVISTSFLKHSIDLWSLFFFISVRWLPFPSWDLLWQCSF